MEEEKNHFYPLFEPLEYYQTQDILSIWNNNHREYIYHKKDLLEIIVKKKNVIFFLHLNLFMIILLQSISVVIQQN